MGETCTGQEVFDSLFHREMRNGTPVYTLKALEWEFEPCLTLDTYDVLSKAEIACARVDEQANFYCYRGAVRRNLCITEAVASVRIAGEKVRIKDVLSAEMYQQLSQDDRIAPDSIEHVLNGGRSARAMSTLSLADTLHFVHRELIDGTDITTDFILNAYRYLSHAGGEPHRGWRSVELPPIRFYDAILERPRPEEIPRYMGYLLAFCNRNYGSPTLKSAIAHYYFETLQPFSWGMDRMGRVLAHMIYCRDRMWRTLILPIGVLPAIATKEHAENLLPYMTKADLEPADLCRLLNNWITYCGQAMEVSARITRIYSRRTSQMIDGWLTELGPIRSDSTTRLILDALPASPTFSIGYVASRLGRSFSSVSSAVDMLEAAGIVEQVTEGRRNRIFEAPDALELFDWIEKQILPRNVTAREAYFDAFGG